MREQGGRPSLSPGILAPSPLLPPLDPGAQPSRSRVQAPIPARPAQDQPLILHHACAAPERPLSISALAAPPPRAGSPWGSAPPLAPASARLPRWQFQLPLGLAPSSCGVLPLSSPPWLLSSHCLMPVPGQRGPISHSSFCPPPGTTSDGPLGKILAKTTVIRFPKCQRGGPGPGARAGRLGAEPGRARVAGLASGAHYKAGLEATRARCGASEGLVSCVWPLGPFPSVRVGVGVWAALIRRRPGAAAGRPRQGGDGARAPGRPRRALRGKPGPVQSGRWRPEGRPPAAGARQGLRGHSAFAPQPGCAISASHVAGLRHLGLFSWGAEWGRGGGRV